jgi:NAD(P)-dependent dehydrogenase (short-subunit alcohol dehydrogenase family)
MSHQKKWTLEDIPDLTDKIAIVTGANSGIGFEDARHLSGNGATVVMGCRDCEKGHNAKQRILDENSHAQLDVMELDLASLDSVRTFSTCVKDTYDRVDILINNAGLGGTRFSRTTDGFELHFGINYLGHFALTGLLLPLIVKVNDSRIVTLSSINRGGTIDFADINCEKRQYHPGRDNLYGRSKLACLLFARELDDRLKKNGYSTISLAAHPGVSRTRLFRHTLLGRFLAFGLLRLFSMSAEGGSRSVLYAATFPEAKGSAFYGPDGLGQMRGFPKEIDLTKSDVEKCSKENQSRLWQISEEMTGIRYL